MTKEDLVNTVNQLDTIKKVINRPVQVVCILRLVCCNFKLVTILVISGQTSSAIVVPEFFYKSFSRQKLYMYFIGYLLWEDGCY